MVCISFLLSIQKIVLFSQSLIWPTLIPSMTICKLRSISIELLGHSHHHYYPAVRSVDSESSQRISSLASGDSLLVSPKSGSVNCGIPKQLCSLTYITLNNAVQKILTLGPGSLLAKIDINSIHSSSSLCTQQIGICWE